MSEFLDSNIFSQQQCLINNAFFIDRSSNIFKLGQTFLTREENSLPSYFHQYFRNEFLC